MDLNGLINHLGPALGDAGVKALKEQVTKLSANKTGWKSTALKLTAQAVDKHGPDGVQIAMKAIRDILEDKEPDIDWADLEVASDVLAHLQNAEADKKSEIRNFASQLSEAAGVILAGVIKGMVKV